MVVEQRAGRVVYRLSRREGVSEHGPDDVTHIRGVSPDGVRGASPVRQCAKVLQLNEGLVSYACNFLGNAARPGGILSTTGEMQPGSDDVKAAKSAWQEDFRGQDVGAGAGKIAVFSGELSFERVEPPMKDSEFLAQRELACREVARIFGIPPFKLGVSSRDSLTYSTVVQQNRAFVDDALRPLAVRIERAISGDADLAPGGVSARFNFDALLRGDTAERYEAYARPSRPAS